MTQADRPPEPQNISVMAGVLSYLVPGLGHIVQGRTGKGFMFMGILLGMFLLGQAMGNWQNVYMPAVEERENNNVVLKPLASVYNRWHFAGQFWIGVAAWPAIWQFYQMPVPSEETSEFWHRFQRPQTWDDELRQNQFLTNSDKSPDLGWVYTVVAGMLNILVIYDAVMGPAYLAAPHREEEAGQGAAAKPQPAGTEGAAS
jgi:hypothetical protein